MNTRQNQKVKHWNEDKTVLEDENWKAPIFYLNPEAESFKGGATGMEHGLLPASKGSYYVKLPKEKCSELMNTSHQKALYVSVAFLKALATNGVNWVSLELSVLPPEICPHCDILIFNSLENHRKSGYKQKESASIVEEKAEGGTVEIAEVVTDEKTKEKETHIAMVNQTVLDEMGFIQDWKEYWYDVNLWTGPNRNLEHKGECYIPVRRDDGTPDLIRSKDGLHWKRQPDARLMKNTWYKQLSQLWQKDSGQTWFRSRYSSIKLGYKMIIYRLEAGKKIPDDDWRTICQEVNQLTDDEEKKFGDVEVRLDKQPLPETEGYVAVSTCPFEFYTTYIHQKDYNAYMQSLRLPEDPPCRNIFVDKNIANEEWCKVVQKYKKHEEVIEKEKTSTAGDLLKFRESHDVRHPESPYGIGCTLSGDITPAQIRGVRGTRKSCPQQEIVAGGKAPVMAAALGWKQLSTKLSAAEWLHLSAFSWGTHHGVNNGTCQSPDNLVFGTSETNSFMLRYEKAWQNLFIFEDILRKDFTIPFFNVHGSLSISTNRESDMDHLELESEGPNHNFYWETLNSSGTTKAKIKGITEKFKFLAYSIHYRVEMASPSFFMDNKKTVFEIKFYPFQRPFYHRLESAFDSRLFKKQRAIVTANVKAMREANNTLQLSSNPPKVINLIKPRYSQIGNEPKPSMVFKSMEQTSPVYEGKPPTRGSVQRNPSSDMQQQYRGYDYQPITFQGSAKEHGVNPTAYPQVYKQKGNSQIPSSNQTRVETTDSRLEIEKGSNVQDSRQKELREQPEKPDSKMEIEHMVQDSRRTMEDPVGTTETISSSKSSLLSEINQSNFETNYTITQSNFMRLRLMSQSYNMTNRYMGNLNQGSFSYLQTELFTRNEEIDTFVRANYPRGHTVFGDGTENVQRQPGGRNRGRRDLRDDEPDQDMEILGKKFKGNE